MTESVTGANGVQKDALVSAFAEHRYHQYYSIAHTPRFTVSTVHVEAHMNHNYTSDHLCPAAPAGVLR